MQFKYYLPFYYTYYTRLGNIRALIAYLVWDLILPYCSIYFYPIYHSITVTAVMFIGFGSLYECGYYYNDTRPTRYEVGGNRLISVSIKQRYFLFARIITFVLVSVYLAYDKSVNWKSYVVVTILTVTLLFIHSSAAITESRFGRVVTFTGLAFYRYAYMIMPIAGVDASYGLLTILFLVYGMGRVLVYLIRKYGVSENVKLFYEYDIYIKGGFILLLLPLFISNLFTIKSVVSLSKMDRVSFTYFVALMIWLFNFTIRFTRRKFILFHGGDEK